MGRIKEYICENRYLMRYIKDKELSTKVGSSSTKKIIWICPNCETEKEAPPNEIKRRGFKCPVCDNSISYSERLMDLILKHKKINYRTQVTFKDCKYKGLLPFDFGIYDDNDELICLVEMAGEQHYNVHKNSKWDSNKIIRNDRIKKEYCIKNKITLYEVDCRKSDLYFIIDNIKKTPLKYILEDIDMEYIKDNIMIREHDIDIPAIIELHEKGVSFLRIEKQTGVKRKTIVKILKKLGKYEAREGKKNNSRMVVCLNNKYLFNRIDKAVHFLGLKQQSNLTAVCKNKRKYCGKVNGESAIWMYYEDYIEQCGYNGLSCPLN